MLFFIYTIESLHPLKSNSQTKQTSWRNPKYWLYRKWANLYSFWMESFNPTWREGLPDIPCQFCGKTDHKTIHCTHPPQD
jgi:hypothetical protein